LKSSGVVLIRRLVIVRIAIFVIITSVIIVMLLRSTILFALLETILCPKTAVVVPPQGVQVLQNGGADQTFVPCGPCNNTNIPGWTFSGLAAALTYGCGTYPSNVTAGPFDRGSNFFFGGCAFDASIGASATQMVNITDWSREIDDGGVMFNATAWLGGIDSFADSAYVQIDFAARQSTGGVVIASTTTIDPVTVADRNATTCLLERHVTGSVPCGTRFLFVRIVFSQSLGLADSLSISLHRTPAEPVKRCNLQCSCDCICPSSNP
jgi:hypothetical protein